MSKLRILFVLFSLVVLAAPASAQRRDGDHEHGRKRGDAEHRDRDSRAERDDDENERDDEDRMENRRGHERDDDEDDDRDDEDEGRRGGIDRTGCIDANGNNVCDITNGSIPATLPEMVNAVLVSRGQLTRTGRSWLGNAAVSPRFSRSGNRTPSKVTWLNRSGAVSQVWLDRNRDGRADVVQLYRGGRLVRTVRR